MYSIYRTCTYLLSLNSIVYSTLTLAVVLLLVNILVNILLSYAM